MKLVPNAGMKLSCSMNSWYLSNSNFIFVSFKKLLSNLEYILYFLRETNEEILEYMKVHNITGKFRLLESLYMNKLIGIITDLSQDKQTAGML